MQQNVECTPSPFLDEIPANLVEYHEPKGEVSEDLAFNILENMKKKFAIPESDTKN
jgi:DNA helicase-2/ATP-dependent DNA helicase PcrA